MAGLVSNDHDSAIDVQGLVLIDSPYARFDNRPLHEVIYGDMPDLPGMAPRQRRRIWASIQRARAMIVNWRAPGDREDDDLEVREVTSRKNVELPPAVLLRGTDLVKTSDQSVAVVDSCRHDTKLGWEHHGNHQFIELVWNVPGSHYSLFDGRNVSCPCYLCEHIMLGS